MERNLIYGGHLMENVSKVITDYIEENIGDKQLKEFLFDILDFELKYQVLYEEKEKKGKHAYSKEYMEIIKDKCE